MQVLKMAIHATVEMLKASLSQRTLKSVTSLALAILVSPVAALGVCKFMILVINKVTVTNIQKVQLKLQR